MAPAFRPIVNVTLPKLKNTPEETLLHPSALHARNKHFRGAMAPESVLMMTLWFVTTQSVFLSPGRDENGEQQHARPRDYRSTYSFFARRLLRRMP